jgi:hypothetical protein
MRPDAKELTGLLNEFLAGASRNDAAVHDRFWAEDLIYTRSAGKRVGKAEIMANVKPQPNEPETTYSAEDIRIQQIRNNGDRRVSSCRQNEEGNDTQVANFLNTGTFLKRDGKWQAVACRPQRCRAPRMRRRRKSPPLPTPLLKLCMQRTRRKLESLTDEAFLATTPDGNQVTRKQFLDQVNSDRLKYPEPQDETVLVYGDAAIVRRKVRRADVCKQRGRLEGDCTATGRQPRD